MGGWRRGAVVAGVALVALGLGVGVFVGVFGHEGARPTAAGPTTTSSGPVSASADPPARRPGSGSPAPDDPAILRPGRHAPLQVALVGDSVAFSLLPSVAAAAERMAPLPGVVDLGYTAPGFGLTADHPGRNTIATAPAPSAFRDWRAVIDRLVSERDPDLFVVMLGTWDTIARRVDGRWLLPGSPDWARWYSSLVEDFAARLHARRAGIVWLLMPCTGRPRLDTARGLVNGLLRRSVLLRPRREAFVEMDPLACPAGVPLERTMGERGAAVQMRMVDHIHFEPMPAADAVAPWLAPRLSDAIAATATRR